MGGLGTWLGKLFKPTPALPPAPPPALLPEKVYIDVDSLPRAEGYVGQPPARYRFNTGENFPGGVGPTNIVIEDYWTLRQRSIELFKLNPFARGLIRRLLTNEINTGLELAATPEASMLPGVDAAELPEWTERIEQRFHVWSQLPRVCDHKEQSRLGELQIKQRQAAFIGGDVLTVLRLDRRTGLPRVQLIDGRRVMTPWNNKDADGRNIRHGVELDGDGRHVAFWVMQDDRTFRRLSAYGARSGRLQAWLVYGTDHLLDEVRGQPLLSLFIQMLKEVDRYKDAALRKAVINSILAMFIKKDMEKMPTMPLTGGAIAVGEDTAVDRNNDPRTFDIAELLPGLVIEELNPGETPQAFGSQGTDEKYGEFEEAMLRVYAWANEIPPEILLLGFSNNYSASQAAINEFKIYLNRVRTYTGQRFCAPIYKEWLLSSVLRGDVEAAGLREAWRARDWPVWGAWTLSEWAGHIKPSTDILKQAKGYEMLVQHGWITNDLAARELTGTKFSKNVTQLRTENEMLADANEPIGVSIAPPTGQPGLVPVEDTDDTDEPEEEEDNVAAS